MKELTSNSPPTKPPTPITKFAKQLPRTLTLLVIFTLGYILGLLSTSPSISPSNSPPAPPTPPLHDLLRFRTQCAPPIPHHQLLQTLNSKLHNSTSPFENFPSPETSLFLLPPSPRPRGWGSTTPVFRQLITAHRPKTIIELGTFLGASALHMHSITAEIGLNETIILCVDDFRGWPGFRDRLRRDVPPPRHGDALLMQQFMATVQAAGAAERIAPVPFSTAAAMEAFCEWGIYGDLVEVDAGHDFHSAWADINRAWAVLRPGGVMFGHDWHTVKDERGVRRAVALFARVKGLEIRPNGQHWVLSPKPMEG